ncbi:hypothetical protein UFOVP208_47 [uncultured Caudovirales phage]|uniref:Uncharacterized protein n=1 Tax=uncultured Caudovirales phage TaxID=2100421 RepID=A0A6J7WJS4_9CAUD|nr:hypothetical protein UFOVP208_47 [uncultured Caudovirales phage]
MSSNSITKRQLQAIQNKSIDLNSYSAGSFKEFKGDAVITTLYNIAVEFINSAAKNLEAKDRIASGALLDSIQPTEVQIFGKIYTLNINVNDYYKFVDKGVKGWQSGNPADSPYSFKQPGKRGEAPKNSKMVAAIKKWLMSEGLKATSQPKKTISNRENRRSSITDASTSQAIKISRNIKKYGLKKTNFWTDAEKSAIQYADKNLSVALEIDILNSL